MCHKSCKHFFNFNRQEYRIGILFVFLTDNFAEIHLFTFTVVIIYDVHKRRVSVKEFH